MTFSHALTFHTYAEPVIFIKIVIFWISSGVTNSKYGWKIWLSFQSDNLKFNHDTLSQIAVIAAYCQPIKKFTYSLSLILSLSK